MKEQTITLAVRYHDLPGAAMPSEWNWNAVLREPIGKEIKLMWSGEPQIVKPSQQREVA